MEMWHFVFLGVTAAVSAGAAFGAVRSALNGTVKRVERIEDKVDHISSEVVDLRIRMGPNR